MTPSKEQFITKDDCKDCRDITRRSTRLNTGMMGLFLVLLGWSLWCSYAANASAAVIRSEQVGLGKDIGWIKDTLVRIEERMDTLHLAGGE